VCSSDLFDTGGEARAGPGRWIDCCNAGRRNPAVGGRTPAEARKGLPVGHRLAA